VPEGRGSGQVGDRAALGGNRIFQLLPDWVGIADGLVLVEHILDEPLCSAPPPLTLSRAQSRLLKKSAARGVRLTYGSASGSFEVAEKSACPRGHQAPFSTRGRSPGPFNATN